jgi:PiT family inorganic phosphate transporter
MLTGRLLAAIGAIGLVVLLGVSDAPNASSSLIAAHAGRYSRVVAWSFIWHLVGGLLAGSAVARTVVGLVRVAPDLLAPTLAAGCFASVVFTGFCARRGIPASASVGLVAGLAGAGLVAGGFRAVNWGSLDSLHSVGVIGVLVGIVLAPFLGGFAAGLVNWPGHRAALRLTRSSLRPLRIGVWITAGAAAFADGTNDGQKAMGILAVAISGSAAVTAHGVSIPWWDKVVCASLLAAATVLGGRRVVVTVARGLVHSGPMDALAGQGASATVILIAGATGLPLSTSSVVTSGVVGAGAVKRRRHVRWRGVLVVLRAWALTVPACALIGAGLLGLWRVLAG